MALLFWVSQASPLAKCMNLGDPYARPEDVLVNFIQYLYAQIEITLIRTFQYSIHQQLF